MGTWVELDEGIFLKSSGKTSLTYSNSAKDGGNNSITLQADNIPPVPLSQRVGSDNVTSVGYGVGGGSDPYGIVLPDYNAIRLKYQTMVRAQGGDPTVPFDSRPNYKNCHIWYRQS